MFLPPPPPMPMPSLCCFSSLFNSLVLTWSFLSGSLTLLYMEPSIRESIDITWHNKAIYIVPCSLDALTVYFSSLYFLLIGCEGSLKVLPLKTGPLVQAPDCIICWVVLTVRELRMMVCNGVHWLMMNNSTLTSNEWNWTDSVSNSSSNFTWSTHASSVLLCIP